MAMYVPFYEDIKHLYLGASLIRIIILNHYEYK